MRKKHNASIFLTLNLVLSFVIKSPAAENARSDSTLVGGIVSRASITFFNRGVRSPVESKTSNSYSCICKKLDLSISDAHFNALYFAFRTDMMTDTYLYSL